MNNVKVVPYHWKIAPAENVIDTTSHSKNWSRGLSPFYVGPIETYNGLICHNLENYWQYLKVYEEHVGPDGEPTKEWRKWVKAGWAKVRADRYPMGKGRKPLYCRFRGANLTYIEARARVYAPAYAEAVAKTDAYKKLESLFSEQDLILLDFDAYDHVSLGMTWLDVLQCETKKMGHAFVLAMMLTNNRVWEQET